MPTIEISHKDLCNIIGREVDIKKLKEELILMVKGEFEEIDGDTIKLEIADSNRPDLWSVEGIARELKGRLGIETGLAKFPAKKSGVKIIIDKNLEGIRPLTAGAVLKGINITDEVIKQLVQLQEKVCDTFGRNREQAAIGIYDFSKITPPINYKAFEPKSIKFKPLDFPRELNLLQILSQHPKGRDYAHLLEGKDKFPLFVDSKGEVLSMPPIINSDHTGKVTTETTDLFVECSGFEWKYVLPALNVMVAALVDRGAKLETVELEMDGKIIETPDFKPNKIEIDINYIEKRTGIKMKEQEIIKLLEQARYGVHKKDKTLEVTYLPYRQDIMHPVDIVEDILIGYGYNNVDSEVPEMSTKGELIPLEQFKEVVSEILVGIGAQEVLSYTLTNKENLFKKMNMKESRIIEIDNPVSSNWCVFRTWVIPSLMECLSKNTNQEYPQQLFEVGQVVLPDEKAETRATNPIRLAYLKANKDVDFTTAKQALDFLMDSLGVKYQIEECEHPSFITGRVGRVIVKGKKVAYIGEINPSVISNWQLEVPVSGFELNLSDLLQLGFNTPELCSDLAHKL